MQYKACNFRNEERFFRNRDEVAGHQQRTVGLFPADECFEADDASILEGDFGLIEEDEALLSDGIGEPHFDIIFMDDSVVHFMGIGIDAASFGACDRECEFSVFEDFLEGFSVLRHFCIACGTGQ